MKIKAVVFDIGQTLVYYPKPLNWSALYRPAFESIAKKYELNISEDDYKHIGEVLTKYNTRVNPRENEVSSDTIFTEILNGTNISSEYFEAVKNGFYEFFRSDTEVYPDAPETLREIKNAGIVIGTLSDVAYGMDNSYVFEDIEPLLKYIDIPFTSNDTGYRKPSPKGLKILSEKMNVLTSEMIFVGDEEKDMQCAVNAGAISILINQSDEKKEYGQNFEIKRLKELLDIISEY